VVVDCQGHVLLEVLQPLGDEELDPERQLELVDLLLVGEVAQDGRPAPVLQRLEVTLQQSQRHFCLGCGAADDGVEGLGDVLQAGEGHAQARAVLVVGQRARHPVEVEADRGGDVLAERLDVGLVPGAVPQQPLVAEPPAVLVLAQHVHKRVHMEPRLLGANAKHHGGAEYPLRHVDLPVEPPAVEDPRAPDPRRAVGPVRVEVGYPLLGPVQPHLVRFVVLVP